jgi:aromatic-L-amino-acid decarboxylase
MRSYGLNGMKAYVRKGIEIGNIFADLVRGRADLFEIVTKPAFCLTVLRVRNPATSANGEKSILPVDETSNAMTKKVYELINSRGEVFLTSTVITGIYAIRVVSANPAADEKYIRRAFEILVNTTEEVLREDAGNK